MHRPGFQLSERCNKKQKVKELTLFEWTPPIAFYRYLEASFAIYFHTTQSSIPKTASKETTNTCAGFLPFCRAEGHGLAVSIRDS